jgi:hypothetical protein
LLDDAGAVPEALALAGPGSPGHPAGKRGSVWLLGSAAAGRPLLATLPLAADELVLVGADQQAKLADAYARIWAARVKRPALGRGERVLLGVLAFRFVGDRWHSALHAVIASDGAGAATRYRLHRVYEVAGAYD